MSEKKKIGRPRLLSDEAMAEAMFRVFARKGYDSTAISDLTRETGMKPATLYLAFGNKEGMYLAALGHYRRTWLAEVSEALENDRLPFEEKMRQFLHAAFSAFTCEGKPPGCLLVFAALSFKAEAPPVASVLQNARLAFRRWLEQEADRAQRNHQLPARLSPAEFTHFMIALESGLALLALDEPDFQAVRSMLDRVIHMLFEQRRDDE
jgi:AcrR family transcriptional regulator